MEKMPFYKSKKIHIHIFGWKKCHFIKAKKFTSLDEKKCHFYKSKKIHIFG
jgi:hypothetical protein